MPTLYNVYLKHATYYKDVLDRANTLYSQGGENLHCGLKLFDKEWANIRAGYTWAAMNCSNQKVAQLCSLYLNVGIRILSLRLPATEQVKWLEAALESARRLQHQEGESTHLTHLGAVYSYLEKHEYAIDCHKKALTIVRTLRNQKGESSIIGNLGNAYALAGKDEIAIECYKQQLLLVERMKDLEGQCSVFCNLGNLLGKLGKYEESITNHKESIRIAQALGNKQVECYVRRNMGLTCHYLHNYGLSVKQYYEAMKIAREIGAQLEEAKCLVGIADVLHAFGKNREAIPYAEDAIKILEKNNDTNVKKVHELLLKIKGL